MHYPKDHCIQINLLWYFRMEPLLTGKSNAHTQLLFSSLVDKVDTVMQAGAFSLTRRMQDD